MYSRSPSPSQIPAPTTKASRSPFPLGLCSCSTSLSKMGTQAVPRGHGALEEMGTYPGHVLYFSKKYLRQFELFPKNQNFDQSCFDPIQKFGMSTRGLTLIFDPVPSTYFHPPSEQYLSYSRC